MQLACGGHKSHRPSPGLAVVAGLLSPVVPLVSYRTGALSLWGAGDPPENPRDESFQQRGGVTVALAELHFAESPSQYVSSQVDLRYLGEGWRVAVKQQPFCASRLVCPLPRVGHPASWPPCGLSAFPGSLPSLSGSYARGVYLAP